MNNVLAMRPPTIPVVLIVMGLLTPAASRAGGVYETPEAFVAEAFAGKPPAPELLWLTADMQPAIERILGHPYASRRLRYWGVPGRTVWVLEEIGKEEPITTGIIVNHGRIELMKVLIYRESRGDEVRHPAFTDQFRDAGAVAPGGLDRHIDGITGATLSVRALTRLAELALYLHRSSRFGP